MVIYGAHFLVRNGVVFPSHDVHGWPTMVAAQYTQCQSDWSDAWRLTVDRK